MSIDFHLSSTLLIAHVIISNFTGGQSLGFDFKSIIQSNCPQLSREEELEHFYLWKNENNQASCEILFRSIARLIRKQVWQFAKKHNLLNSMEDLEQEASVGFMEALKRFDPEKEVRLSTYAGWWWQQRMVKFGIADTLVKVPVYHYANPEKLDEAHRKTRAAYHEYAKAVWHGPLSLSQGIIGEEGITFDVPDNSEQFENQIDDEETRTRVQQTVRAGLMQIPTRDRIVLEGRMEGKTLYELSLDLGISRERVRQVEMNAKDKLKRVLERGVIVVDKIEQNGHVDFGEADPVELLESITKLPEEAIEQALNRLEAEKQAFDQEYRRRKKLLLMIRKSVHKPRPRKLVDVKKTPLGDSIRKVLEEMGGKATNEQLCKKMNLTPQSIGRSLGALVNQKYIQKLADGTNKLLK